MKQIKSYEDLSEEIYSRVEHNSKNVLRLKKISSLLGIFWVANTIIVTLIIISLSAYIYSNYFYTFCILYPLIALVVAGRQGAFLQLVHEGAHSLITRDRALNDLIGNWVCGGVIGISMSDYRSDHGRHHNYTGTENDSPADLEKYRIASFQDGSLKRLFVEDIMGISALRRVRDLYYGDNDATGKGPFMKLVKIIIPQLMILIAANGNILLYFILWVVPLLTVNMFLMRIRGIAEHGMPSQMGIDVKKGLVGILLTRTLNGKLAQTNSLIKLIEKILIGSLSINYHLEHHIVPNVPHYNLRSLNSLLNLESIPELKNNYKAGYFSALYSSLK